MSKNTINLITEYGASAEKTFLPPYYIIEPTNHCNFKCVMCPNKLYKSEQKGHMSFDLFKKIIKQISESAVYIQLYWMGEPLLCPNIFDMISYIKQNTKAKVILSTNGSLLEEKLARKILYSGLDILIISIDAISSSNLYSSIRCGGALDRLISNTEYFLKNNTDINVILQMISFKKNTKEADFIKSRFSAYKFRFQVSWLDTWAGQFPEINEMSFDLSPNRNVKRLPCSDLWYKASIHWDGKVTLCCHDWNWEVVVGDLRKSSMAEIWNSNLMRNYRKIHCSRQYEKISLCQKCTEWATIDEYGEFLF